MGKRPKGRRLNLSAAKGIPPWDATMLFACGVLVTDQISKKGRRHYVTRITGIPSYKLLKYYWYAHADPRIRKQHYARKVQSTTQDQLDLFSEQEVQRTGRKPWTDPPQLSPDNPGKVDKRPKRKRVYR